MINKKVLMIGWELPPFYAGGVGMVCYDILKEFDKKNVKINYLMPFTPKDFQSKFNEYIIDATEKCEIISENITIRNVKTLIRPYETVDTYSNSSYVKNFVLKSFKNSKVLYGDNLYEEVDFFGKRAYNIADKIDCDIVYSHDWMTVPAAIAISQKKKVPFVFHIHNTVYDRGHNGNFSQVERDIEKMAFENASKIISISEFTKNNVIKYYGVDPDKIQVIHNAPPTLLEEKKKEMDFSEHKDKFHPNRVVLFTGRLTFQKGIDKFIYAAKKVSEVLDDVLFIIAGGGHLFEELIELTNNIGIGDKVLFTGTYNMYQGNILYQNADVYVMPSVSEPFGIVPFEAIGHSTPTIISKTSGCSEVLHNCLKVDYHDVDKIADYIVNVLEHPELAGEMVLNSHRDINKLSWSKSVDDIMKVFNEVLNK